jgi:hypothetical protein
MAIVAAIAFLSVAFYSWLLVVLCVEYVRQRSGQIVHLERGPGKPQVDDLRGNTLDRAA